MPHNGSPDFVGFWARPVVELPGASLMMPMESVFHLFGFPGRAIPCFAAAATGGC